MNIEELIRNRFLDSNGRLTYGELVENFKENFINNEQFKADFKKAVNRLATVKQEQDKKYLVLKPKYQQNQKKNLPDGLKSSILEALKSDDTSTRQQNVSTLSDFESILDSLEFSINNNAPVGTSPIPEITVTDNSANVDERLTEIASESVISSVIYETTEDKLEHVQVQHKVVDTDRNVKASCESIESQSSSTGTAVKRSHSRNRSRLNSSNENFSVNSITLTEDELKWILASASSDLATVKKLLSKNVDLANSVDFTNGYTALHYAAKNGILAVVQLLMAVGKMDVDRKSGYTALHLATMHGHSALMGALVDVYGANKNIRDNNGRKAEHYLRNAYGTKAWSTYNIPSMENFKNTDDDGGVKRQKWRLRASHTTDFTGILYPQPLAEKKISDAIFVHSSKENISSIGFGFKSHIKSCHSFPTALNSGTSCARDNRIGSLRKISSKNYTEGDAIRLRENRSSRNSVVSDKHKSAKM